MVSCWNGSHQKRTRGRLSYVHRFIIAFMIFRVPKGTF